MICRSALLQFQHSLVSAVIVLTLAWAAPCFAAPIIDQSHIITQSVGGLITVAEYTPAQTFTVGQQGALSKIDVQIGRDADAIDDLMLEIWSTASGVPSGALPLFTTVIPASSVPVAGPSSSLPFTSIDVTGANLNVTPGQVYAVAVRGTADFDAPNAFWNWGRPGYSGGDPYATAFGRPWEQEASDYDFGFRTWVDPNPVVMQTLQLTPIFDAAAKLLDGQAYVIGDGNDAIPIRRVPHLDEDERAVLEFDLTGIPDNATIRSASLKFDIDQRTFGPDEFPIVELYGYAGDGEMQPTDANDISNLLGTSAQIDSFDTIVVELDVAEITDLRFASDFLGMIGYQRISPHSVNLAASELAARFPGSYIPPTLSIRFEVTPPPARRLGDYNGNGVEDAADYVLWRNSLGQSGDNLAADGNNDGTVDEHDYAVWRRAFSNTPPSGVRNGDFATGDLSEWDVVVDTNTNVSFGFPRVESFDVDGDGTADPAMRIRLGRVNASLEEGGTAGIEQEVLVASIGDFRLSADFAAASFQDFGNTAPGRYELLFDDTLVDFVDLNGTLIDGFQVIRGNLEAELLDVAAGFHTVRLLVHRPGTNTREIYGYYDHIELTMISPAATTAVPEPATLYLVILALGGAAMCRERRPE